MSGCWIWLGHRKPDGYGTMTDGNHKTIAAYRFAYEMTRGPVPPGQVIDHLCRNHACVNPAHLEAVTERENILRGASGSAQNAKKTRCPRGHDYRQRQDRNARYCPICAYWPIAQRAIRKYKNRNPVYDEARI